MLRPEPFAVDVQRRDDVAVVLARGELDLATADTLRAALDRIGGAARLVLDLRGLSFIDSTGLHMLVALHERAQREGFRLTLVAPPAPVDRAIRVSGLDEVLPFAAADDVAGGEPRETPLAVAQRGVEVLRDDSPTSHATPGDAARHREREADDLRAYADDRDPGARERLIHRYLPLANSIARRFDRGDRVPLDDLRQIAAIGLLKALDRYDPAVGTAFSTFAVPTMQGEIRRYFRDFSWTVRPPRELQERAIRIERERERLTNDLGRNPTARELAAQVGCTLEELLDASEAAQARGSDSFDRRVTTEDGDAATLGERLGGEDHGFDAAEASATARAPDGHAVGARPARAASALPRRPHPDRDRPTHRLLADARVAHPARRPRPTRPGRRATDS